MNQPKTVLVTGASSGIGQATARRFARSGWNVVATTRREGSPFPDGSKIRLVRMEQSDPQSVAQAVAEATAAWGRLDVLVNNAAHCLMGPLEATRREQIRRQYEVNLFGLIEVIQAALPHLKARRGGIINIASISADNGYPFNAVYSSSKAAVMALTEGLNIELDAVGVFAKAVLPGLTATEIFTKLDGPDHLPEPYHAAWARFLGLQRAARGFSPDQVADMVFAAATDGRVDRIRYYATADAVAVPAAKRMLGQARYWRRFRRALLQGPGWLEGRLAPRGTHEVAVSLPAGLARPAPPSQG